MDENPVEVNEEPATPSQDPAVTAFQEIVSHYINEGKGILTRINEAKTELKRSFYRKKLNKNNQILAQALMMLEKYKARADATAKPQE